MVKAQTKAPQIAQWRGRISVPQTNSSPPYPNLRTATHVASGRKITKHSQVAQGMSLRCTAAVTRSPLPSSIAQPPGHVCHPFARVSRRRESPNGACGRGRAWAFPRAHDNRCRRRRLGTLNSRTRMAKEGGGGVTGYPPVKLSQAMICCKMRTRSLSVGGTLVEIRSVRGIVARRWDAAVSMRRVVFVCADADLHRGF